MEARVTQEQFRWCIVHDKDCVQSENDKEVFGSSENYPGWMHCDTGTITSPVCDYENSLGDFYSCDINDVKEVEHPSTTTNEDGNLGSSFLFSV